MDIMPAGALVLWRLAKHSGAQAVVVSKSRLREGLLYQELLHGGEAALALTVQNGFSFFGPPRQEPPRNHGSMYDGPAG